MTDDESSCRWRLLCFGREVEIARREAVEADGEFLLDLAPRVAELLGRCGFREAPGSRACGLEVVRLKSGAVVHVVPPSVKDREARAAAANRHRPKTKERMPA